MNNISIEEKYFIIQSDNNKNYELTLRNFNNEEFSIGLYLKDDFYPKKYKLKYNLEEFQKNRFFKIFINTDEIMRELENKIEKSKIIEETNVLYLVIPIGLTIINEIILEIKEIEIPIDEKIEEFKTKIESLNNKLKENDKIIEENKNKIETLDKKLKEKDKIFLENEKNIEKLNKKLNEKNKIIEEYEKKIFNIQNTSKILEENEIDLVKNWLKNNDNNKYENISFELLYRASRDDDSASKFHKLCDGKGPTIIFIKNEDDFRYGAYTSKKWKSSNEYESDPSSFLFSLTNKEKYLLKNKNNEKAIYHSQISGPSFGMGSYDLFIPDNCFKNKHFSCYSISYQFDNKKMYNDKKSFCVKDYEVYLVKFK